MSINSTQQEILENSIQDLGLGAKVYGRRQRLVNKKGSFNVKRSSSSWRQQSIYQWLVLTSWPRFLLVIVLFYLALNTLFASLYLLVGIEQLSTADLPFHPFWVAFFFSVQTLTTVGYGSVSPIGFGANVLAAIGALVGLLSFALATGLLYARFSKARIKILYSKQALISPYQEKKALMFRMVNARKNVLSNVQVLMILTWVEETEPGQLHRRFSPLTLERNLLAIMPLNWTVVHPIGEDSPLAGWQEETCTKKDVEVVVVVQAYDDSFANIVRSYHSYKSSEIIWNAQFEPMYHADEDGVTLIQIEKLSDHQTS